MAFRRLNSSFFLRSDVVAISRDLLGKRLCTRIGRAAEMTAGIIVETEAYAGPHDRASHAFGNRYTRRTAIMFQRAPVAYVYLCYGMHWLFNIITNIEGIPHAVLVRALQPTTGIDVMLRRRGKRRLDSHLTSGPGSVARALGIRGNHSGVSLLGNTIWIEDGQKIPVDMIGAAPRVGVSYAGKDALLPWRFYVRECPWVSRPA